MVSNKDYAELSKHKWCASKLSYGGFAATRDVSGKTVFMHRVVMNAPKELEVDHKNHDTLDNRPANLRLCTSSQNQRNMISKTGSSRYKGVCWYKRDKIWQVQIKINGKMKYLGRFESEIEAAEAYNKKAVELFGDFAYTNFREKRNENQT